MAWPSMDLSAGHEMAGHGLGRLARIGGAMVMVIRDVNR